MKREIEKSLNQWRQQSNRLPILLRGARQVGKTYTIERFGRDYFAKLITINFELQPHIKKCFETLEPVEIINKLQLILNEQIEAGKTLLFLDEIQECPQAIMALRYFKEKMPDLHVIGAGSLLEFSLNAPGFHMPVGRIQFMYLYPLSFEEFLDGSGYSQLREYLTKLKISEKMDESVHQKLLELTRLFFVLGGMPAVINTYIQTKDIISCQRMQTSIIETFKSDFGKYARQTNHQYLRRMFEATPRLVGQRFKYVHVDAAIKSRELKEALNLLILAGLLHPVCASSASGVPLGAQINEQKFKLIFLDVGLVQCVCGLQKETIMAQDLMQINAGYIAEQFVGQEWLAQADPFMHHPLYFWVREKKGSEAEVDYVINIAASLFPIEVKSGKTGTLKSLKIFLKEKKAPLGIRISQNPLSFYEQVLSVPLYMIKELPRLISEVAKI